MKKYKLLLFLLLSIFACNEKDSFFETSADGLVLNYKPIPGGAVLNYVLPNDRDIFSMNIRYNDNNGNPVLKSCGYSGDSILLDGFTKGQKAMAKISFINNYGKESQPFDYEFTTEDSAPWTFFNGIEVNTAWDGFRVIYPKTTVATGMAHVFYLGENPINQMPDTILMSSFPINAKGDTLTFVVKQLSQKNTIVIRTEDFAGYRVRQEIYPDIESFVSEKLPITKENFDDGGLSIESDKCKTGVKYLFDEELKGKLRITAPFQPGPVQPIEIFGVYLAGPQAFSDEDPKPFIIDMKKDIVPARVRLYALHRFNRVRFGAPAGIFWEQGKIWNGNIDDKVPCKIKIYGATDLNNESSWTEIGILDQDPKIEYPWYSPAGVYETNSVEELERNDPIFYDIYFPAKNDSYRYLILKINDTFDLRGINVNFNKDKYITLTELEVYVKMNIL